VAAEYRVLRYAVGNAAKAIDDKYSLPAGGPGATGIQPERPRPISDEEQAALGEKMQKLMAAGRTTEALQLMQRVQGQSVAAAQAYGGGPIAGDWNHWMKCLQEESEAATYTAIERYCGASTDCPPGD
jgi:hypothetical protein